MKPDLRVERLLWIGAVQSRRSNSGADGPTFKSNRAQPPIQGPNDQSNSGEVFAEQVGVDGERRLGPLGRGYDHPLDGPRGVARHVEAGQMGRFVPPGPHGALVVELASEPQ